jgi:hypothetical protein
MSLLSDPQAWLSFLTLAVLEIVLGIDNIIFLAILVERLPRAQRSSARILGLSFAMLTRIALLFSIMWLATLRNPLFSVFGYPITGRDLILFAGGALLAIQSVVEIFEMLSGKPTSRKPGAAKGFWLIILQIGLLDIVFSLDSVFTAVGLANRGLGARDDGGCPHSQRLHRQISEHQSAGFGVSGTGRRQPDRGVLRLGDSKGLPVFCDGFLGRGRVDQHTLESAAAPNSLTEILG